MTIAAVETQRQDEPIDEDDLNGPCYEQEAFDSLWQALRWEQIRVRVPKCMKKTIRSRYMLANVVYLVYAIGILIIDFDPNLNGSSSENATDDCDSTSTALPTLDQPIVLNPLVNRFYIGLAVVHVISAFLYWWAWKDRTWRDVIMIPEYLNHIEAGLYLWSAIWYSKEDTLGGYYTICVHRIELTAATVELFASLGWIMSWYMTYVRAIGRGFTLNDPDTVAWLATSLSSVVYMIYNIQINVQPEQYGTNLLYTYGDIVYFVGSCYYIFATLRDEKWLWFLPVAGQYGIAEGKIETNSIKVIPTFGKPVISMTDPCKRRRKKKVVINTEQHELPANDA